MIDVDLVPFERRDFARLRSWITSPEFLLQWAGPIFDYPLDDSQLENYVRIAESAAPLRRIYRAENKHDRAVIGHIELDHVDPRNKSATVCRVLVGQPSLRRKGVGMQMMQKLLGIGFEKLGLHRIDLVVFDFNEAAIRCYEKAGFVREGCLRESRRMGHEYWTLYQMSILEQEWRLMQTQIPPTPLC